MHEPGPRAYVAETRGLKVQSDCVLDQMLRRAAGFTIALCHVLAWVCAYAHIDMSCSGLDG